MAQKQEKPEMSVEEALAQLKELLGKMETEGTSLEDTFTYYERGMHLVRYCQDRIDQVEQKVQKLNADGSTDDFQ